MKKIVILILALLLFHIQACSNVLQDSVFDKDLEGGVWDSSRFEKSKWQ